MEKFKSQLNEIKNWTHELSLGEQQLISDEASLNLDEQTEFHLYNNLKKYLPHTTLISVVHRSSSREFHEIVIDFNVSVRGSALSQNNSLWK